MTKQTYSLVTGVVFLVVTIAHGLRLVFGWDVSLGGQSIPIWASWIAIVVAGYLSYSGLKLWRSFSKEGYK